MPLHQIEAGYAAVSIVSEMLERLIHQYFTPYLNSNILFHLSSLAFVRNISLLTYFYLLWTNPEPL